MKLTKMTRKATAVFLSLIILQSAFMPSISFALTSGPGMPEYSSFEPVDTSDMVNLFTGDMTYNMPLLTVPSPEGGYPLSLSYHSGIQLNEEASWVGLGWTLNPGAISRSTVVYPDDYCGTNIQSYYSDPGGKEFSYAIGGGFGPNGATIKYDSNKGWGGSVSLGIDGTPVALTLGTDGVSANIGIPTSAGSPKLGASIAYSGNGGLSGGLGLSKGVVSTGMTLSSQGLSSSSSFLGHQLGSNSKNEATFGDYTTKRQNFSLYVPIGNTGGWVSLKYSSFKYHLSAPKDESAYGMLYYQDATVGPAGQYANLASFDHYQKGNGGKPFQNTNMVTYSPDIYSVSGQGISGNIRPYRASNGSVSVVNKAASEASTSGPLYIAYKEFNDRPEFRFIGEPSNDFQYHYDPGKFHIDYTTTGCGGTVKSCAVSESLVQNDPPDDPLNGTNPKQYNGRLASGKYIEWFSNDDLETGDPIADPLTTNQREQFPGKGIGAIRITNTDGTVYTYAIPVYNTYQLNYTQNKLQPNKNSSVTMSTPYAYTWLLTSITGPDYVDRSSNGQPDEQLGNDDWGYWVRFDYGKWTDYYHWLSPYGGAAQNMDNDNLSLSYGNKQIYYLNKIVTRTHTALFVKEPRSDGKGASSNLGFGGSLYGFNFGGKNLGTKYSYPGVTNTHYSNHVAASLMKLSKIMLFKNEDLIVSDLTESIGDPLDNYFPDFHFNGGSGTIVGSLNGGIYESASLHLYDKVLDADDIANSDIDLSKVLKIVEFNTDYSLCKNVPNNFDTEGTAPSGSVPTMLELLEDHSSWSWGITNPTNAGGKLTLNEVEVKGSGGAAIMPSTKFDYSLNPNPNYDPDKWDGWGMYSSSASYDKYDHQASGEHSAWTLNTITTPLGGKINIRYERDMYCSSLTNMGQVGTIKGDAVWHQPSFGLQMDYDNKIQFPAAAFQWIRFLKPGQKVTVFGTTHEGSPYCQCDGPFQSMNFSEQLTISAIKGTDVTFSDDFESEFDLTTTCSGSTCTKRYITSIGISGIKVPDYLWGGNDRVASISVSDELKNEYKTWYEYSPAGPFPSSGISGIEPEFIRGSLEVELNSIAPMVGYGRVEVSTEGANQSSNGKSVYEFNNVSVSSHVVEKKHYNGGEIIAKASKNNNGWIVYDAGWLERDESSKIGTLKSVSVYNKIGLLLNRMQCGYFNSATSPQGIISEGVNMNVREAIKLNPNDLATIHHRLLRTTRVYYPSIMAYTILEQEGINSYQENKAFDFYTGNAIEAETDNSLWQHYKSKSIPAYTKYDGMGSKFVDPTNKNMLGQETANYLYSVDGVTENLLSASVQTWKNDGWFYSTFTTDGSPYEDETAATGPEEVWRKFKNYVWKSTVNQDGTLASFTDFDWSASPSIHAGWQKINEITRYDHYSKPIESMDINGNYSANKNVFRDGFVAGSSGTSNYRSFTVTGFEDLEEVDDGMFYFEGEVEDREGVQATLLSDAIVPHTGKAMAKIPEADNDGPIYKVDVGIQKGKTYRAAAWVFVNANTHSSTRLVAKLGGSHGPGGAAIAEEESMYITDANAIQVGNWKLLRVDIDVPADYHAAGGSGIHDLRVFVSKDASTSHPSYVDDMRLHPINSPVSGYVWDEQRGLLLAMLDNENFATLFTYDEAGRLVKTEKETKNGIKKVSETEYHYGRP